MSNWTPDREGLLKTLWVQGLSAAQIAKRLGGVTRNAVIGKCIRMGLPGRVAPNKSYGPRRKPKPHCAPLPRKPKSTPTFVVAPIGKVRAPTRGPNSIRFMDRAPIQCPMFCVGEDGPEGFVCGSEREFGSAWCKFCAAVVYTPFDQTRRAV